MRVDMLRSSPACSHWRSARRVGNHTGTVPSGTCGSNNMPSIIYLCLAAAHITSTSGGQHWCFLSAPECGSENYNAHLPARTRSTTPSALQELLLCCTSAPTPVTHGDIHPPLFFLPSPPPGSHLLEDCQAVKSQWGAKLGLSSALLILWVLSGRPGHEEIRQIWIFHINTSSHSHFAFPPYLSCQPLRHLTSSPSSCEAIEAIILHRWPPPIGICNGIPSGHHNSLLCPHLSCHCSDVRKTHRLCTKWRHPAQAAR